MNGAEAGSYRDGRRRRTTARRQAAGRGRGVARPVTSFPPTVAAVASCPPALPLPPLGGPPSLPPSTAATGAATGAPPLVAGGRAVATAARRPPRQLPAQGRLLLRRPLPADDRRQHSGRDLQRGRPARRRGRPIGFFFLLIVIAGIFFAWRTVRRTAAPIADVMSAADRVADGDYAVRVEAPAKGEVGRLVESFNAMTTRLQTNEEQRRNLFADVAHELRTPLSVIRGNTEGMLDGVYPRDDARLETILGRDRGDVAPAGRSAHPLAGRYRRAAALQGTDRGRGAAGRYPLRLCPPRRRGRGHFTVDAQPRAHHGDRPGARAPGAGEPARQRPASHAARRHDPHRGAAGGAGGPLPGGRYRQGHRAGGVAAYLRPLLEVGRLRRQRTGSRHCPRPDRGPRRAYPRR